MTNLISRFAREEDGTALIEYTLLLGIVVVAVVANVNTIAAWIGPRWLALANALSGA